MAAKTLFPVKTAPPIKTSTSVKKASSGVWTPEMEDAAQEASQKWGLPVPLIKAVIYQESGYNPLAVSKAGAKGLMQLMPETAKALGVTNPFDIHQVIMAGTRYLSGLYHRFNQSYPLALAAYNAGPQTVFDAGLQVPHITETQNYVKNVMARYKQESRILNSKFLISVNRFIRSHPGSSEQQIFDAILKANPGLREKWSRFTPQQITSSFEDFLRRFTIFDFGNHSFMREYLKNTLAPMGSKLYESKGMGEHFARGAFGAATGIPIITGWEIFKNPNLDWMTRLGGLAGAGFSVESALKLGEELFVLGAKKSLPEALSLLGKGAWTGVKFGVPATAGLTGLQAYSQGADLRQSLKAAVESIPGSILPSAGYGVLYHEYREGNLKPRFLKKLLQLTPFTKELETDYEDRETLKRVYANKAVQAEKKLDAYHFSTNEKYGIQRVLDDWRTKFFDWGEVSPQAKAGLSPKVLAYLEDFKNSFTPVQQEALRVGLLHDTGPKIDELKSTLADLKNKLKNEVANGKVESVIKLDKKIDALHDELSKLREDGFHRIHSQMLYAADADLDTLNKWFSQEGFKKSRHFNNFDEWADFIDKKKLEWTALGKEGKLTGSPIDAQHSVEAIKKMTAYQLNKLGLDEDDARYASLIPIADPGLSVAVMIRSLGNAIANKMYVNKLERVRDPENPESPVLSPKQTEGYREMIVQDTGEHIYVRNDRYNQMKEFLDPSREQKFWRASRRILQILIFMDPLAHDINGATAFVVHMLDSLPLLLRHGFRLNDGLEGLSKEALREKMLSEGDFSYTTNHLTELLHDKVEDILGPKDVWQDVQRRTGRFYRDFKYATLWKFFDEMNMKLYRLYRKANMDAGLEEHEAGKTAILLLRRTLGALDPHDVDQALKSFKAIAFTPRWLVAFAHLLIGSFRPEKIWKTASPEARRILAGQARRYLAIGTGLTLIGGWMAGRSISGMNFWEYPDPSQRQPWKIALPPNSRFNNTDTTRYFNMFFGRQFTLPYRIPAHITTFLTPLLTGDYPRLSDITSGNVTELLRQLGPLGYLVTGEPGQALNRFFMVQTTRSEGLPPALVDIRRQIAQKNAETFQGHSLNTVARQELLHALDQHDMKKYFQLGMKYNKTWESMYNLWLEKEFPVTMLTKSSGTTWNELAPYISKLSQKDKYSIFSAYLQELRKAQALGIQPRRMSGQTPLITPKSP